MSQERIMDLYRLLPALYRIRDAEQEYPLRALLDIVADQADMIKRHIDRLAEDFFIETCERWVVPYIGELVGNNPLHDIDRSNIPDIASQLFPDLVGPDLRPGFAIPTRADVAKTIYYRRRKGTLPMLEELARDVTGWAAHAVEFFQLLAWTQHLNHTRPRRTQSPDLRHIEALDHLDGPFDEAAHTVDVRFVNQSKGWHNIRNMGFFLWRLNSYPLRRVSPRPASTNPNEWRFHFSPLGNPAPLFTARRREADESGLATPRHVPAPITPVQFFTDLRSYQDMAPPRPMVGNRQATELYGPLEGGLHDRSFYIYRNGAGVDPALDPAALPETFVPQIVCRRLDPWPSGRPGGQVVAVDVESGRLAVGSGLDPVGTLEVSYHYGFSAHLGGGPYERRAWLSRPELATRNIHVGAGTSADFGTLTAALADWALGADPKPNTIVTILDSRTYDLPAAVALKPGRRLAIQAANEQRPLLRTDRSTGLEVRVEAPGAGNSEGGASLTLNGVVIEGHLHVTGDLEELRLLHTTLVPGRRLRQHDGGPETGDPSLMVEGGTVADPINTNLHVHLAFAVTGPLRIPEHAKGLWTLDSIIDGVLFSDRRSTAIAATGTDDQPGPPASLRRTTIFGPSYFRKIDLASDVLFTDYVETVQRQEGCVRFSYVPDKDSTTPRRYRCQPDLEFDGRLEKAKKESPTPLDEATRDQIKEAVRAAIVPRFTHLYYGHPGYAQLRIETPRQILSGAEDESEIGAFSHLKQPQRIANLRLRLNEYLPFGLEPGMIFVT